MNPRRYSVRAALLVVGSIAVAAVTNGCNSAPSEQTGKSGEDLNVEPCLYCNLDFNPGITSETSTPSTAWTSTNSPASCPNTTVPVPASLAGFGCTLGVAISGDAYLPAATFSNKVQAYAWACPSFPASSNSATVAAATTVSAGGFNGIEFQTPLETTVTTTINNGTFGAPAAAGENVAGLVGVSTTDSCYGVAKSGWEIVMVAPFVSSAFECKLQPGTELPTLHGMAFSSLDAVHRYLVACPVTVPGGCECPGGGTGVYTQ